MLPWTVGGRDSSIADMLKLSDQHIALAYRVPLQILGLGEARYASTELLMNAWIANGLGFALNHVEQAFDRLFGLAGEPKEYCEFDTDALLRSAHKDRIDALVKGVQGGIYSPNEARDREGLDPVEYGDEPRVQQQVVPLSAAGKIPAPAAPPAAPAAPAAIPPPAPKPRLLRSEIRRGGDAILAATARHERRKA